MNFRKRIHDSQAGFQMAPMVDMMFILLINFMAMTIYAQWENKVGITVPTAETGAQGVRTRGELIINLDEAGTVFINSQPMTRERLGLVLHQIADEFKSQPVIIRADRKTHHEDVIAVLDLCRMADIWNVAFSTLPPEASKAEHPQE